MAIAVKGLAGYADELLALLADPARGIVRKSKFIPTLAEMCEFMDAEWDKQRRRSEQAERDRQRALPPPDPIVSPETRAKVVAEFQKLRDHLHASRDPAKREKTLSRVEIKDQAERWLEREAANPHAPKLSRVGLRSLGVKTEREAAE